MSEYIANSKDQLKAIEEAAKIPDVSQRMARLMEINEQAQYIGGQGNWVDRLDLAPKKVADIVEKELADHHRRAAGYLIKATESADPLHHRAQQIVDEIARANPTLLKTPPVVYINTDLKFSGAANAMAIMGTDGQPIIEVAASHAATPETPFFRGLLTHEAGHIVNGDYTTASEAHRMQRPANLKTEMLANRMGSILHGNVPEYYATMRPTHAATATHPGGAEFDRELKAWLPFLEQHGAVDAKGVITDVQKAVEAFTHSKWINFAAKGAHL